MFAGEIRKKHVEGMRAYTHWRWHLDEVYVKIHGEMHYLWRAVERFRRMKTLQKFAAVHGTVHNHFNNERHLTSRETFKQNRLAALVEWQTLMG